MGFFMALSAASAASRQPSMRKCSVLGSLVSMLRHWKW